MIGRRAGAPAGSASGPAFELRGVVVRRGRRRALEIDDLAVERGEVLGVVGPNGAGKTTLLHVLALLVPAAAGELRLFGRPPGGWSDRLTLRRRTAMVMQHPTLLDLSAIENAALPLRLRGWPAARARAAAGDWLERFGVAHLSERPAGSLSGGEAQRVSLARALVTEPDALFLDEPFGALDWPSRWALIDDLREALRGRGVTAVLVTHDPAEAAALARRVAVLQDGRLHRLLDAGEVAAWAATERAQGRGRNSGSP